jgi:hypothetical protein
VGIHDSAQFKDTEIYAPLSVAVGVPVGALLPIGLSSCRHDWRARVRKRRAKTVLVLLGCRANGAVEPNHLAIQHLVLEDMTHERGFGKFYQDTFDPASPGYMTVNAVPNRGV